MKKSGLLIAFAFFISAYPLLAKQVNVATAQTVAGNFYKLNAPNAAKAGFTSTLIYTRVDADNTVEYYVFNMAPDAGFVIVAADDVIKPILAYSTESVFNPNLNRTGVKDWMNNTANKIHFAIQRGSVANERISNQWVAYKNGQNPGVEKSVVVSPMVKTLWNQEPYYNAFCPYNSGDQQRAVTGCVATAMAQIMKFWSYPIKGVGSNSYNDKPPVYSNNYGVQSANFGATTYNWTAMPNSIGQLDSGIANLMYQCGVSVDMDYGDDNEGGSAAEVISYGGYPAAQTAYINNFSYDPTSMQGVYEQSYDSSGWLTLMENELLAGRPIQYIGADATGGGHTWVCDGFSAGNLLHMNWGWGGSGNGYFAVSYLDAGGYDFTQGESALIGIKPIMPVLQVTATSTALCTGGPDTTQLTAAASSGVTYQWTPATGLTCPTCATTFASPTTTTTYTVKIDSAGVMGTAQIVITVHPGISVSTPGGTAATCYGSSNGGAVVSVSGGTTPYQYGWSNGEHQQADVNLAAGTYIVTVTDAGGCSGSGSVDISQPAQIVVTPDVTDASSCSASDGSVALTASGGNGGTYSYSWNTGSSAASLTSLSPGVYTVTVKDAHNCTTVTDIAVPGPYQIQFSVTTTNASNGNNGAASVENVSGGTGSYTYSWSNGATTQSVTGLAPGAYMVTVSDGSGCFQFDSVVISVATAITKVNDALSYSLFPNPARNLTTVQLSKLSNGTTLQLENVLGQTVVTKTVTDLQTQLDLSQLSNGVYFVVIQQGEKRAIKQLVVSR